MHGGTIQFVMGVVILAPLGLILEDQAVNCSPNFIIALVQVAIFLSLISITLLMLMIRRGQASRMTSLFFLVPPTAAAMAWIMLDESLTPMRVVVIATMSGRGAIIARFRRQSQPCDLSNGVKLGVTSAMLVTRRFVRGRLAMARWLGPISGAVVLFVFVAVLPAHAGMDEASEAFERGDLKTAFKEFMGAAESGNAIAQYNIGLMLAEGLGTKQNFVEAARWYRKAAEQGHADAQYELSELLYWGNGVPVDLEESAYWTRLAAEQGHADAQYALGSMYFSGEGVPLDLEQSAYWTRLAADQGLADAQYDMGWAYYLGEGVDQNLQEAIRWTRLAAEQGLTDAQYDMGEFYYQGDGVPVDWQEAAKWFELAAAQGNASAQSRLDEIANGTQHAGGTVDPALVGMWEMYIPNGQSWSRWTLDIAADGTYSFAQDGVFGHSGTFQARDGAWQLVSQTNGWTDAGTYQLPDGDTFNMIGKLGPGSWKRVIQ